MSMGKKKPGSYNYMNSPGGSGEDGGIHRVIRNLLIGIMVVLIAISAFGLVWMFRTPPAEEETVAEVEEETDPSLLVREALEEQADEHSADGMTEDPEPLPPGEEQPETDEDQEPEDTGVQYQTQRLEEGETLETVAEQYDLDPRTLVSVNEITSAGEITEGMELRIPDRDGKLYTIRAGDSLSLIAHRHGMGYITLARENNLDPDSLIYPGDTLFIPRITMSTQEYERIMGRLMIPPVEGDIITEFGEKTNPVTGEKEYPGVEFESEAGTMVVAVMDGEVIGVYDDSEGLGKYIEIAHDDGYETIYGHLDEVLVEAGDSVSQGESIGESGSSGMTLDPLLYFSISKDGVPVDPREFF